MIEKVSLDIVNYWTSKNFLTESNKSCGTLLAFDWRKEEGEYYLTEINTNIDLSDLETDAFGFDDLVDFLKQNMFTFLLGLRNSVFMDNPSEEWTNKLKELLKSNEIEYEEYIVENWPAPIPEFNVPDNIFILRYSYDEYSKIDQFASNQFLFEQFIEDSSWKKYYKTIESEEKMRVIVLCSDIKNIVLHGGYIK